MNTSIKFNKITFKTLGDDQVFRTNCSNHKLGCGINLAMLAQGYLLQILKTLSSANDHVRTSVKENRIFRDLKCRPCIYQRTRWLGASNLLLSGKRCYDKGAYDGDVKCPVDLVTIETYIQILQPAYFTTLGW